ncbi:hypothetical protein FH975_06580 [Nesterenkonia sp. Hz 6-5]|nr:hypothetical protein [Nesterenkonia haasae]
MTEETRGLIEAPRSAELGEQITVEVGDSYRSEEARLYLFSDPLNLGSDTVDANGEVAATLPSDDEFLGEHRLAVYQDNGSIIGWTPIELVEPAEGQGPGDNGQDSGSGTGTGSGPVGENGASPSPEDGEETDDTDELTAAEQSGTRGSTSDDSAAGGSPDQSGAKGSGAPLAETGLDNRLLIAAGILVLSAGLGSMILLLRRRGEAE